jgi:thiol-disulfide isomerase/thioredoxin
MVKRILIVLLFIPFLLQAQQTKTFRIIGHSNYYNNSKLTVSLGFFPLSFNECIIAKSITDTVYNPNVVVHDGQFELFGSLNYPHPLLVSYYDAEKNRGQSSEIYFIEGGDVPIDVDDLTKNHTLGKGINNKANQEYGQLKRYYSSVVDTLTHVTNDMGEKQKLMRTYIVQHPDSYVALWDLVVDYSFAREESIKKNILENTDLFSPVVKKSKTYIALTESLKKSLTLVVGNKFPDIALKPSLDLKQTLQANKFTLIDFWATWCKPCIAQMPDLKKVYSSYNGKGFTLIGISVDKKGNETVLQKVVQKLSLDWPQFWDEDGKEANRFYIDYYPMNFLLDNKGMIVKKDLSPEELNMYLKERLTE